MSPRLQQDELRPRDDDDERDLACPRCHRVDGIVYDDEYDELHCTRRAAHWRPDPRDRRWIR